MTPSGFANPKQSIPGFWQGSTYASDIDQKVFKITQYFFCENPVGVLIPLVIW